MVKVVPAISFYILSLDFTTKVDKICESSKKPSYFHKQEGYKNIKITLNEKLKINLNYLHRRYF
uniref:Uncharacterized protein n=1 Tax=Myoviridae sp. ctPoO4 TaxID=2827685 RepID=A0A8S5SM10_9CAUD|nr:MAG TPA: hypothetical protein [Myoviridae sp. ctPoO4]